MSMSQRIRRIRQSHPATLPPTKLRAVKPTECRTVPARATLPVVDDAAPRDAFIAYQRKSLEHDPNIPWLIKWFLRRVYDWYGFAATDHDGKSYCKTEYRGVFLCESDARWAASCPGGQYRSLPINAALPEEMVGYGIYDVPCSEESANYRNHRFQFVAVSSRQLELLEAKVEQVVQSASA